MPRLPIVIDLPPTVQNYLLMYPRFTMYYAITVASSLVFDVVFTFAAHWLAMRRIKRSPFYYLYLVEKELGNK